MTNYKNILLYLNLLTDNIYSSQLNREDTIGSYIENIIQDNFFEKGLTFGNDDNLHKILNDYFDNLYISSLGEDLTPRRTINGCLCSDYIDNNCNLEPQECGICQYPRQLVCKKIMKFINDYMSNEDIHLCKIPKIDEYEPKNEIIDFRDLELPDDELEELYIRYMNWYNSCIKYQYPLVQDTTLTSMGAYSFIMFLKDFEIQKHTPFKLKGYGSSNGSYISRDKNNSFQSKKNCENEEGLEWIPYDSDRSDDSSFFKREHTDNKWMKRLPKLNVSQVELLQLNTKLKTISEQETIELLKSIFSEELIEFIILSDPIFKNGYSCESPYTMDEECISLDKSKPCLEMYDCECPHQMMTLSRCSEQNINTPCGFIPNLAVGTEAMKRCEAKKCSERCHPYTDINLPIKKIVNDFIYDCNKDYLINKESILNSNKEIILYILRKYDIDDLLNDRYTFNELEMGIYEYNGEFFEEDDIFALLKYLELRKISSSFYLDSPKIKTGLTIGDIMDISHTIILELSVILTHNIEDEEIFEDYLDRHRDNIENTIKKTKYNN